jgi:hypothetical protein
MTILFNVSDIKKFYATLASFRDVWFWIIFRLDKRNDIEMSEITSRVKSKELNSGIAD